MSKFELSVWFIQLSIYFYHLYIYHLAFNNPNFELLSSSLLLYLQRFCRYALRSSSYVCRTPETTRNFEPCPLLNPLGSLVPLIIAGFKWSLFLYCYSPAVRLNNNNCWWADRDYPNDSIDEDGQNTETCPGDLRILSVTQTPVKNHQLILIWKTLEE